MKLSPVTAALLALPVFLLAQSYTYDAAGRLTQVAYPQGGGLRYAYDADGNLTSSTALQLPAVPSGFQVTQLSATSTRLTWQLPAGATGIVVQRRINGGPWQDLITSAVATSSYIDENLDPSLHYEYRVAAVGVDGRSAYSAGLSAGSSSALTLSYAAGGAVTAATLGTAKDVQDGYAKVDVASGAAPYGTAVFSIRQNDVVTSEAGVPASPPTTAARIFIDYRTGVAASANQYNGTITVTTGFAAVNLGKTSATIQYTLRGADGQSLATGVGTLAAGAHVAKTIDALRDIAPGFNLPAGFPTANRFGSLDLLSTQPLSVVALRATSNQRGELLFTSTPTADLTRSPGADPVYFPHLADGGGFSTSLILLNTTTAIESGTVQVFGDDGRSLTVDLENGASGASFPYFISPGGVFRLETRGTSVALRTGWVRLLPDPGSSSPAGAGVFRLTGGGVVVTEAGIPAAIPTTHARFYVDKSGSHDAGIAIANPGTGDQTLTVSAFALDGTTPAGSGPATLTLRASGHAAQLAGDLISQLPAGYRGVLDVVSATPFVALNLRALFNERGELLLTTFPNADLTRPAPSPVIFPHIADGGGFRTEFILLSAQGAATTSIQLFASDGTPLSGVAAP